MGMFLLIGNSIHGTGFSRSMGLHEEAQDVRVHSTSKDALVKTWCITSLVPPYLTHI